MSNVNDISFRCIAAGTECTTLIFCVTLFLGSSEGRMDGKESVPGNESEVSRAGAGVRGGAVRPQRAKGGETSSLSLPKNTNSHSGNTFYVIWFSIICSGYCIFVCCV